MYFIMLQMGIQMNYYKQTFAPHIEGIAIRAGLIEENEMAKSRVIWQDRDAKASAGS